MENKGEGLVPTVPSKAPTPTHVAFAGRLRQPPKGPASAAGSWLGRMHR